MTTDRPQDGLKTFKFLSDAKAWLADHGMALHAVTQVRRIYTYANADLSVWVEITMGDCVAVAPIKRPVEVEAVEQVEEPQAIVGLPSLDDETFWGSRLTPAEAKASVRRLRDDLSDLTANLSHLDHDASRAIERARSALFEAWSVIRSTEKALVARDAR